MIANDIDSAELYRARELFRDVWGRVRGRIVAEKLWYKLSPQDRLHLGGNFSDAYEDNGGVV